MLQTQGSWGLSLCTTIITGMSAAAGVHFGIGRSGDVQLRVGGFGRHGRQQPRLRIRPWRPREPCLLPSSRAACNPQSIEYSIQPLVF